MASLQAMWVHGNTVRPEWVHDNLLQVNANKWDGSAGDVPWSDVNGLPRGWGSTYRGKHSSTAGWGGGITTGPLDPANPFNHTQKGYWFHFAIPTPVINMNVRSLLQRVFVLWDASPNVEIWAVHIYDGIFQIATIGAAPRPAASPTGRNGLADLIEGVSMFSLPQPHEVWWSIGISVAVSFLDDGDITFISAGADFIV